jgi:hypothetical protein
MEVPPTHITVDFLVKCSKGQSHYMSSLSAIGHLPLFVSFLTYAFLCKFTYPIASFLTSCNKLYVAYTRSQYFLEFFKNELHCHWTALLRTLHHKWTILCLNTWDGCQSKHRLAETLYAIKFKLRMYEVPKRNELHVYMGPLIYNALYTCMYACSKV